MFVTAPRRNHYRSKVKLIYEYLFAIKAATPISVFGGLQLGLPRL